MKFATRSAIALFFLSAFVASGAHAEDSTVTASSKVKFNALAQFWTINDTTAVNDKFNFRLRRAELKFSGSVVENTRWFIMADPAKSLSTTGTNTVDVTKDNKVIQDLGVAWNITPDFEVVGGQFKILTTAEGLDSSSELLFPERSAVARAYGDVRDQGVQLNYKAEKFKIGAMVSNGINPTQTATTSVPAPNVNDVNSDKDLSLRVDANPIDGLKVGAFTFANEFNYSKHGRYGANARWDADGLLVRFEGVLAGDYGFKSKGWNLDGGYTLNGNIQPIARWEGLTSETAAGDVTGQSFWLGVNYLMAKHNAKIQLAGGALHNMTSVNSLGQTTGTYTLTTGGTSNNKDGALVMLAFQAAI